MISKRYLRHLLLLLFAASCCSCASSHLKRSDYTASINAFAMNSIDNAIETFPDAEKDGFITNVEKAYLHLWKGTSMVEKLNMHANIINDRLKIDISEEIGSYFYGESKDGYYASEHEIIWLHLLLGLNYCKENKLEAAGVEARICSDLLENATSGDSSLDDSLLRVLLASLWTAAGLWDEAQVDFRTIYERHPSFKWCNEMIKRNVPPKHIILVLGGIGPEPRWTPEQCLNIARGLRQINFIFPGRKSKGALADNNKTPLSLNITPDSSSWYQRRQARDTQIHKLVQDSRYFNKLIGTSLRESLEMCGAITYSTVAGATIIAIGAGIVYLSAEAGEGEGIVAGIVVATMGPIYAFDVMQRTIQDCAHDIRNDLDAAENYRFVRFMPEYLWFSFSDDNITYPLQFTIPDQCIPNITPIFSNKTTSISITHCSDILASDIKNTSFAQMWNDWVNDFSNELLASNTNRPSLSNVRLMIKEGFNNNNISLGRRRCTLEKAGAESIRLEINRGLFKKNQKITVNLKTLLIKRESKSIYLFLEKHPACMAKEVILGIKHGYEEMLKARKKAKKQ